MSQSAHEAQLADPAASAQDQHEVLMVLAEALRRTGDWAESRTIVHRAIDVGRTCGDIRLVARAATSITTDALGRPSLTGQSTRSSQPASDRRSRTLSPATRSSGAG